MMNMPAVNLEDRAQPCPKASYLREEFDSLADQVAGIHEGRCAVFLDRDGTLNVEQGYLWNPKEARLLPRSGEALALLNMADLPVIIITNQSGIGRGIISESQFESVNQMLWDTLQEVHGARYDALYYCPHDPTSGPSCACRKPQTGLILQAAVDLGIDLERSYFVGDKRSDIEAGVRANCRTVLLLTGHGNLAHLEMRELGSFPDHVALDLFSACHWILSDLGVIPTVHIS